MRSVSIGLFSIWAGRSVLPEHPLVPIARWLPCAMRTSVVLAVVGSLSVRRIRTELLRLGCGIVILAGLIEEVSSAEPCRHALPRWIEDKE